MKVEYVTSILGVGTELHISSDEYKRINSEMGRHDRQNLLFAINSYSNAIHSIKRITVRDIEEAFRHIKKIGTIILAAKTDGEVSWCEVYAVTEGAIIPVVTSEDGVNYNVNKSDKTKRQIKRLKKEALNDE